MLVFAGLARGVFSVFGVNIPSFAALSPFPHVFDKPKYFATAEVEVLSINGESKVFTSLDLQPYIRGPWHRQILIRHGLMPTRSGNNGHIEQALKIYFCKKALFTESELEFEVSKVRYAFYLNRAVNPVPNFEMSIQCL
jgi:hypothetical protein